MGQDQTFGRALVAIAVTLVLGRALSGGLSRVRQPRVIGEILVGLLLGPTVLGAVPGEMATLFPTAVMGALNALGQMGLTLFMFEVGLDIDLQGLRSHGRSAAAVCAGALVLPFTAGLGVAAWLYGHHRLVGGHPVPRYAFALFVATALSITAFPVLARIVRDSRLEHTRIGQFAIATAGGQDAAGWALLSIALALSERHGTQELIRIAAESTVFMLILLFGVRRVISGAPSSSAVLIGLCASGGATQLIGLHMILGAFAFGLVMPRRQDLRPVAALRDGISPLATSFLLPIYFLTPGLHANLRAFGGQDLIELGVLFVCASAGKLVGASLSARAMGFSWREAGTIGALLNTRGLVELVVLDVGRRAGILDANLFSMLVVVAVATTLMTGPLVASLQPTARTVKNSSSPGLRPIITAAWSQRASSVKSARR